MTEENPTILTREEIAEIIDQALGDNLEIFPLGYELAEIVDLEALVTGEAGINDPLGQLASFISDVINAAIAWAAEAISSTVKGFIDNLWNLIDTSLTGIGNILDQVSKRLTELGSTFEGFVNAILRFPDWFPDWFKQYIATPISDAISDLAEEIWDKLPTWLKDAIKNIPTYISQIVSELGTIGESIYNQFKSSLNSLIKACDTIASNIEKISLEFLKDPLNAIQKAIEGIWNLIPEWLKKAIQDLVNFADKIATSIEQAFSEFIQDPLGFIQKNLIEPLAGALSNMGKWIWEMLPDWLKKYIEDLVKFADSIATTIEQAFAEFIKDPIGFIKARFEELAKFIWENLPDWLKNFLQTLQSAWEGFIDWLSQFQTDPWKSLEWLLIPLAGAAGVAFLVLKDNWEPILKTICKWFSDITKALIDVLKEPVKALSERTVGLMEELKDFAQNLGKKVSDTIKPFISAWIEPIKGYLDEQFKQLFKPEEGQQVGEVDVAITMVLEVMPHFAAAMFIPKITKSLAHAISRYTARARLVASPLDVGLQIALAFFSRLAHTLYEVGDIVEKVVPMMLANIHLGFILPGMEPFRYPFRYMWKKHFEDIGLGDVPFEIPPLGETRTLIRRIGIDDNIEYYKNLLRYRGFPNWFIDNETKLVDELALEIKDRFNTTRKIPLSPIYFMPTPSDLTRMMIKDIFGIGKEGLERFTEWAYRLGFTPDLAFLYYLLHFRYPSPERLWEFTARSMSGLLWYVPSQTEFNEAKEHAEAIGAKVPIPPPALNFQFGDVFRALTSYLKWQDYANFAWIDGFTSDAWIVMDTMADIPSKIDVRWMTKWAMFDHLASKNITVTTPSLGFLKVIEERGTNPNVYMDLSMMCRLIQATGLHPHYVPIVAVAEAINAVAEERTFLRTGVVDMYRYGASDFETIDQLLDNLVVATFKVSYVDLVSGEWKEGFINLPVKFLPAERRILELRAVIDRYMKVWREMWTDLESGYREYIISEKSVTNYLNKLTETINKYFSKATATISGREIKFSLDESYVDAILEAWSPAREVYTFRRIRYWFYRVLGWLIYRLAFGYVKKEDIDRIVNVFTQVARLAPEESNAITVIAENLVNIIKREYIPTPSMMATISEIVPLARKMVDKVLEERGVPEEWRPLWKQYITTKIVIDEVKKVVTSAEDLYEYFMIDEKMYMAFLQTLIPYGYEAYELKLMKDRADLERWHRAYRELVGTPRELVTFAEYSPMARRLALAEVKKRIDALPISQEEKEFLYKMWEDYIRIKPVYDEVEREITELITDYANGVLTWEQFNRLLEELKNWGIDEWEIDSYRFIAMMRRIRYQMRSS